jgi:hypothetical protein
VINREVLLIDLKRLLARLEGDLRERADEVPTLGESLRSAYERAKQAERTAQPFETWREEYLTQVAAAWVLACVFVRFIEDNGLIDTPLLAGSGPRLDQAKDQRTLYFQQHPTDSDREYLYYVFRKVEALPAAKPLFDERHNPLWAFGVSGDGATLLVEFWQRIDPATGALGHDFADPALNTRFLGDLYQDLSEAARKKYALLQTPEFVEEFILDRTLTPAIAEFGLAKVRLIDPACGSGHFLLGAFHRLLHEWQKREPAVNVRELAQRALNAVCGVDLNPYAVAIARFRLLIAALKVSDVPRLADAPAFRTHLATGDSLLHGPRPGGERQMYLSADADPLRHVYDTEDAADLRRILGARYHVVVGNPPYITVKDKALNKAYRDRFGSCYRQYSLAVPFMERFFDLARPVSSDRPDGAGFVGMITADSFMKGEFGKRLIEQFMPRWELVEVVYTAAYIPGHATATVIIVGRSRDPILRTVRTIVGIRGEPQRPLDPAGGLVWLSVRELIDRAGSSNEFVSVEDLPRDLFNKHPWTVAERRLTNLLDLLKVAGRKLESAVSDVGAVALTRDDDVFVVGKSAALRVGFGEGEIRPYIAGEHVRDWSIGSDEHTIWPYSLRDIAISGSRSLQFLWLYRTQLAQRVAFGQTQTQRGLRWHDYSMLFERRLRTSSRITFANVATHNHFVAAVQDGIYNAHAPVCLLRPEVDVPAILSVLNSSVACFWLRQVMKDKGLGGIGGGIGDELWERRLEYSSERLLELPLPTTSIPSVAERAREFALKMSAMGAAVQTPIRSSAGGTPIPLQAEEFFATLGQMVAMQEELDWLCYRQYGVLMEDLSYHAPPRLELGQRAFEVVLARKMESGEIETTWFERHGSIASTQLPADWPDDYRAVVEKRIAVIESDPNLAVLEQPEYKRRWNYEPLEERVRRALRDWLAGRLEAPGLWSRGELASVSRLADLMRHDQDFMEIAALYRGRADFDLTTLVNDLVEADAVPFLPVLRYKESGARKRATWERTWSLQRQEDVIDARAALPRTDANYLPAEQAAALKEREIGDIPVPPKYTSVDFVRSTFWSLRGKVDVPKERFVSYPHAERDADSTLVIGWAGWDNLQQAKALAAYYVRMKEHEGWAPDRLKTLLAGLLELIPWLKQWHNDLDPSFGIGMGDYFAGFVDEEARTLGFTQDDVRAWQPPARNPRRRRRASV